MSTLKQLAKNAKKRLSHADYSEKPKKTCNIIEFTPIKIKESQIQINKLDTSKEDVLKKRILDLLEDNFYSPNPISQLIDFTYYNNLDDECKQRYILEITNLYTELRTDFLNEKNKKFS